MVNIPLFAWFYTPQVVQDFFHQQYGYNTMDLVTIVAKIWSRSEVMWSILSLPRSLDTSRYASTIFDCFWLVFCLNLFGRWILYNLTSSKCRSVVWMTQEMKYLRQVCICMIQWRVNPYRISPELFYGTCTPLKLTHRRLSGCTIPKGK